MTLENLYTVTIDIKRNLANISGVPTFIANDTAIIHVKILNDGQPYDYSNLDRYVFSFKRPDGIKVSGLGTYDAISGMVKYNLKQTEMEIVGNVQVEVQLYLGTTRISTKPFSIKIIEDFENNNPAQEGLTLLQELFVEVESLKTETLEAKDEAFTQATYAKNQGDYAKSEGDRAKLEADNANAKALLADEATTNANTATQNAITATTNAENATTDTITATENADLATTNANNAATNANDKATYAQTQGDYAKGIRDNFGHKGDYSPTVTYKNGNVVSYGGINYICIQDTAAGIDPLNGAYWTVVSPQASINDQTWTATEGQTVFTITNGNYVPNQSNIQVLVGGVPQVSGQGFTETNSTTITLSEGVPVGTTVFAKWFEGTMTITKGHKTSHELGGQDELDVSKLYNYKEMVSDKFDSVNTQLADIAINVKNPFGTSLTPAKGDGVTDDTIALQAIIDYCIQNGYSLYLPYGEYKTTFPLVIWQTIKMFGAKGQVYGANNSQITYYGNDDGIIIRYRPTKDGAYDDTKNVSGIELNDFTIARNRSGEVDIFGTQGVGINCYRVLESSLCGVSIYGFKVNIHFQSSGITKLDHCDFVYGQYGIWLSKKRVDGTTGGTNSAIWIEHCNIYTNKQAAIKCGGSSIIIANNHMEQTGIFFDFEMDDINRTVDLFSIHDNNLHAGLSDFAPVPNFTDSTGINFSFKGTSYQYINNLIFKNNRLRLDGVNAKPINYNYVSGTDDVDIVFSGNRISGAELGIVVSNRTNKPYISLPELNDIKKYDESSYSSSFNIYGNGKIIGMYHKIDKIYASNNVKLSDNTSGSIEEGEIYYDYTGHFPKVRSRNRTLTLLPVSFGTSAPTSGQYEYGDIVFNSIPTRTKNITFWQVVTPGNPAVFQANGSGYGTTAERPALTSNDRGYSYYDTTLAKMILWNGSSWLV